LNACATNCGQEFFGEAAAVGVVTAATGEGTDVAAAAAGELVGLSVAAGEGAGAGDDSGEGAGVTDTVGLGEAAGAAAAGDDAGEGAAC